MTVVRGLLRGLLALSLLLTAAAGGLWIWSGSQASLQWAWDTWLAPRGWQAQDLRGSLREGLRAQRLVVQEDGLRAEVQAADLAWRPWELLLQRRVHLTRLRAALLRVEQRPSAQPTSQPPQQLVLPVPVAVDELALQRLEWHATAATSATAAPAFQAGELAARYAYDLGRHQLTLHRLSVAQGRYSGEATLEDRAPLSLKAHLQGDVQAPLPRGQAPLPLALQAQAEGPLAALRVQARLQAARPDASTPQADVTAQVTPWQAPWVTQAHAQVRHLDLATLWPRAPRTDLQGAIDVTPQANLAITVSADLANARPGAWDRGGLPLSRLAAQGQWQPGEARMHRLDADIGGGTLQGQGQWSATRGWQAQATVQGVRPGRLYSAGGERPVSGALQARTEGAAIAFETDLRAAAPGGAASRTQAASPRDALLALRELQARGRWQDGRLQLPQLVLRTDDAALEGAIEAHLPTRSGQGRLSLAAPGLRALAQGRIAEQAGQGSVALEATQLPAALAWLQRLPGLSLPELPALEGEGRATLEWIGGWRAPQLQARLDTRVTQGTRRLKLTLAGQAQRAANAWQGRIDTLQAAGTDTRLLPGDVSLQLQATVPLRLGDDGRLELSAGRAVLTAPVRSGPSQAQVAWEPLRWGGGELHTAGRITGLPMAWLALAGGVPPTGDLLFDAQWDAHLARELRLRASLARASGDITLLAENAEGQPLRVTARVREARLSLEGTGDALTLGLRWDSERAGTLDGRLATRLSPGGAAGWQWAANAPVSGRLQARLPRMAVWSVVAPPGWRLRGSLAADLAVDGSRDAPRLAGTLNADDLGLRSVVDGVALQEGRLRARVDGTRLLIDELTLRGPSAPGLPGGSVRASGEARWVPGEGATPGGAQVRMTALLSQLRASVRADRQLTVSGEVQGTLDRALVALSGALRVDRARIQLPDQVTPRLDDDVVVRNLPAGVSLRPAKPGASAQRPVQLDVAIDLGEDFRVQGRGISTRLHGAVTVSGTSLADPRLNGRIDTAGGQVQAYGQRLDIDHGILRFTGPADDPALDVLAVRPNLTQKVGVQVTGRAQAPRVRLWAEPELPEAEKLSWLVLGRASANGGAEAALLEQAAVSLLAQRTGMGGTGLAGRVGLDELSVRRGEGTQGAAITFGKRFASNFYAAYERSLSGALGTLLVFYDLTRTLTLRAQAGDRAGLDLIYTLRYD